MRIHSPISAAEVESLRLSAPATRTAFMAEDGDRIISELDKLCSVRERAERLRRSAIEVSTPEAASILWAAYKIIEEVVREDNAPATLPGSVTIRRRCQACQGERVTYNARFGRDTPCESCSGAGELAA